MLAGGKQRLDGDRQTAAQFLPYLASIRSFISKRVSPDDVDDMVQDVALRMHQRVGPDGIDNVEGYLFQIARSVLTDHGRRNQARMTSLHDPLENHSLPTKGGGLPDRIVEDRQELRRMLAAVQNLPQRSRQAFVLHRFEHMSYLDIAKHMDISVSAVEKNIMRAIRQLVACRTI